MDEDTLLALVCLQLRQNETNRTPKANDNRLYLTINYDHCLKYVVSLALSLKGVLNTKYFLQTQAFPYLSPCTLPSKFTLLVLHQFLFLYVFRLADSIIVTLLIVTVNTRVVDCRKGQLKADGPHSQQ